MRMNVRLFDPRTARSIRGEQLGVQGLPEKSICLEKGHGFPDGLAPEEECPRG